MEDVNHALFFSLNAREHLGTLLLVIATFFAKYAIWVISVIIGIGHCVAASTSARPDKIVDANQQHVYRRVLEDLMLLA